MPQPHTKLDPTASRRVWFRPQQWLRRAAPACLASLLLAACGGGGDNGVGIPPPPTCSSADQKEWLRDYMDRWYYWYAINPNPSPAGYPTVGSYFDALLYTGTNPAFPADRWSYYTSVEDFDRFFVEGRELGYGLMVSAIEAGGDPAQPLYVRYVDPGSPADVAGISRGDRIVSLNGRSAADLIEDDDFGLLVPLQTGDRLVVRLEDEDGVRSTTLQARVYSLYPVPTTRIVTTPEGRKMGYVLVKDMITQALTPLDRAFARFQGAGVDEVAIDLRYNGGGLVSVATDLASYPAADTTAGKVAAKLLFNDKRAEDNNQIFRFADFTHALGMKRVYLLTGPRTCSASEQVINALRPYVDVVTVGDTSCGKPVGFLPQDNACGTVYNVVNFESVNARNQGRYFNGFAASCAVAEDFSKPLGASGDPLLAGAMTHADTGACPAAADPVDARLRAQRAARGTVHEPGSHRGMIPR